MFRVASRAHIKSGARRNEGVYAQGASSAGLVEEPCIFPGLSFVQGNNLI
jgi:hypothetical protein